MKKVIFPLFGLWKSNLFDYLYGEDHLFWSFHPLIRKQTNLFS